MKNILIFNDISGLGNCSMTANLPIFSKLGHYCMPVVTANFSCQTGFQKFTVQRNDSLVQCASDVTHHRKPDCVYVGFCADAKIARQVDGLLQNLDGCCLFVDPILGDNGKLYSVFNGDYVAAIKQLVSKAHCISPNLTEACMLADVDYNKLISLSQQSGFLALCGQTFQNFLQTTGAKNAVITGVPCGDIIGNIVLEEGKPIRYVTNDKIPVNFSGTGDVFSSVLLGKLAQGSDLLTATQVAANFVANAAAVTACSDRRFGVEFCKVIDLL